MVKIIKFVRSRKSILHYWDVKTVLIPMDSCLFSWIITIITHSLNNILFRC
jgi:hypothetical protein